MGSLWIARASQNKVSNSPDCDFKKGRRSQDTPSWFYEALLPLKVVAMVDSDPPRLDLCNGKDILVNWNISQKKLRQCGIEASVLYNRNSSSLLERNSILQKAIRLHWRLIASMVVLAYLQWPWGGLSNRAASGSWAGSQSISGAFHSISHSDLSTEKQQLRLSTEQDAREVRLGLGEDLQQDAFSKHKQENKQEGVHEGKMMVAFNMIQAGEQVLHIAEYTDLPLSFLGRIKHKHMLGCHD